MANKKLIFAVDDEQSIREVYEYALNGENFSCECFENGDSFFEKAKSVVPDLVLLDIMLDGIDGYEILAKIRQNESLKEVPVIMVSAKGSEIDKVKGLNLGSDDYIAKPFGILELIARINANLRRSTKNNQGVLSYKDISFDIDKHEVSVANNVITLTHKQYELLKILTENAEKVISRDNLLDSVWGENYGETRTLDIHIGEIRKLLQNSSAEIATVRGVGYMLK